MDSVFLGKDTNNSHAVPPNMMRKNRDIEPTLVESKLKKQDSKVKSRVMTADKVHTYMLKDKKAPVDNAVTLEIVAFIEAANKSGNNHGSVEMLQV